MSNDLTIRRSNTHFENWGSANPLAGYSGSKTNPLQFSQVDAFGNKGGFNMNPWMIGLGAAGGLLNYLNKPQSIGFTGSMSDFQQTSPYRADPNLLRSIHGIGKRASTLDQYGDKFMNQYDEMLDPNSAYNQAQYSQLREQVGDQTAQTAQNQNMALAQRGIGSGGMAGLLGATAQNRGNESVRQGTLGIQSQSLAGAGQFGNMATGAVQGAGSLAAQSAGLRNQIDARRLANEQFNVQGRNQYQQYLDMGQYNANVQNQNANQAWSNNNMGLLTGMLGMFG
tara:strand:+ start:6592 stop:7437 length:846 start_codon:yes stop_codon:yes gene_type:complete